MFRGRWGKFFAFGLAAVALAAVVGALLLITSTHRNHVSIAQQAEARANAYTDQARIAVEGGCRRLSVEGRPDCINQAYEAAREGQRKEYDLEAQLVTSAWTRAMGIAAIYGTAFGVIGVGLVWLTFWEARSQTRVARREYGRARLEARAAAKEEEETRKAFAMQGLAARRAASAAGDANNIAREMMHLQMRPHVYLTAVDLVEERRIKIGDDVDDYFVHLKVTLRNFGQSPAKGVNLRARCFFGNAWNEPFEPDLDTAADIPLGAMPPNLDVVQDGFTTRFPLAEHQFLRDGSRSIFIEGQLRYSDDFGTYITNFRQATSGQDARRYIFHATPDWNEGT
jgi:hypothetical protein